MSPLSDVTLTGVMDAAFTRLVFSGQNKQSSGLLINSLSPLFTHWQRGDDKPSVQALLCNPCFSASGISLGAESIVLNLIIPGVFASEGGKKQWAGKDVMLWASFTYLFYLFIKFIDCSSYLKVTLGSLL